MAIFGPTRTPGGSGYIDGGFSLRSHVRWRHTSGRPSRANGYMCGNLSSSPNLGRKLFPCGVFLRSTESAGSMAHRGRVGLKGAAPSALCALVRCSQPPSGARPSECIIIMSHVRRKNLGAATRREWHTYVMWASGFILGLTLRRWECGGKPGPN
jgi:hypothetical protein